jgi:hypothetical protein
MATPCVAEFAKRRHSRQRGNHAGAEGKPGSQASIVPVVVRTAKFKIVFMIREWLP